MHARTIGGKQVSIKKIPIGILGLGTVGTGVARLLYENADILQKRLGAAIEIRKAADLDITRDRGIIFPPGVLTTDPFSVINDPEIRIVVELIGGTGIAFDLIKKAIGNKKHIVTANKALLAAHGNEIFDIALANGVSVAFEASCGGCIPIIKTLRETLAANRISKMAGILNGTCNYILTQIEKLGISFKEALSDAQKAGYAEADPTLDIEGYDTAHKLAILSALAFGTNINFDGIYTEGISFIEPIDIEFASRMGYRIKLLAIAKFDGSRVEARVHPTMIPKSEMLSNVDGSLNAVSVTGDAVGTMMLYGHGAGMMPTASAVISDTVDIARGLLSGGLTVPMAAFQPEAIRSVDSKPMEEIESFYYFRFAAVDRPGVLAKIAGILGNHDISIKSVHQEEQKLNDAVPVFILTHKASEAKVCSAMEKISRLDVIEGDPVLIRIEEGNQTP